MLAQKGLRLGMFREGATGAAPAPVEEQKSAGDEEMLKKPIGDLELSVVGTNLDGSHVEFDEHGFAARIPRAGYVQLRWEF